MKFVARRNLRDLGDFSYPSLVCSPFEPALFGVHHLTAVLIMRQTCSESQNKFIIWCLTPQNYVPVNRVNEIGE